MIAEYALEPGMVAKWGDRLNYRFFIREFGLGSGRQVSRYPKKWARKVWESFPGGSEIERKRLEELLVRLQETIIRRKDFHWDENKTWLDNALQEHSRHAFRAILTRKNPVGRPEIIEEDGIADSPCPAWDSPHGRTVCRTTVVMLAAVKHMLICCRWVKFIDPYFVKGTTGHKKSLSAFLKILSAERPVGRPQAIEIHTTGEGATTDYLKRFYEKIIPVGLQVTIYRWQQRPGGQKLHNRYILTDLGGVSFHHGLDTGREGETDDLTRLDLQQYFLRCNQYNPAAAAFDPAASPLVIIGIA
jgi:hypothetical protein